MSGGFHPQHTSAHQGSLSGVHWHDGYDLLSSPRSIPFGNHGQRFGHHHRSQSSERRINSVASGHKHDSRPHSSRTTAQNRSPRPHRHWKTKSFIAPRFGLFSVALDNAEQS